MRGALLGHEVVWRRCVCFDCGDPMRDRAYARKLRKALRLREREQWRRELRGEN